MRSLALACLLFVFVTPPLAGDEAVDSKVLATGALHEAGSISTADRVRIVGPLKEALNHASSHEERVLLRAALIHLQDQDTISHVLCGFSSSHTANERGAMAEVFRLAKAPATIPLLVDYIYLDDRDEHILRDAIGVGRKDYIAARLVADLLANCPEFKASTRASAREVKGLTSREIRERIRAWWPENRSYFERKDYKSVEPLETEMPRGVVR